MKLLELYKANKKGLVLSLPCRIGSDVYKIRFKDGIAQDVYVTKFSLKHLGKSRKNGIWGETVFETHLEATEKFNELRPDIYRERRLNRMLQEYLRGEI